MSPQQIGIFHFVEIYSSLVWLTSFLMLIQNLHSVFKMKYLDSICRSQRGVVVSQIFKQISLIFSELLYRFDIWNFQ